MLRFKGVHSSIEERTNIIRSSFADRVLPVFAMSCVDGILLIGFRASKRNIKTRKLLDRVAFAGVGNTTYRNGVYESVSAHANTHVHMVLSPGDMRAVDYVVDLISKEMMERFRDLYSANYIDCEFLVAKVDLKQEDDQLIVIDLSGHIRDCDTFAMIPSVDSYEEESKQNRGEESKPTRIVNSVKSLKNKLSKELSMRQNLIIITESFDWLSRDNGMLPEVAMLLRQNVAEKKFQNVYRKLSQEEIVILFDKEQ